MKITNKPSNSLIPYINNPRKNDAAVDKVAASIKEFGFIFLQRRATSQLCHPGQILHRNAHRR